MLAQPQQHRLVVATRPQARQRRQEQNDFNLDNFVSFDSEDEWEKQVGRDTTDPVACHQLTSKQGRSLRVVPLLPSPVAPSLKLLLSWPGVSGPTNHPQ